VWIYSWNFWSKSARVLAKELDAYLIRHEGSRFVGRPYKAVINWGSSVLPTCVRGSTVLNSAPQVALASNKLNFLETCVEDWRPPPWTSDPNVAKQWLKDGKDVVARTVLNGHSGAGIRLIHPGGILPYALLYTKYIPKSSEWRIHCVGNTIIDIQRKAAKIGEVANWQIRNHDNGFIYARDGVPPGDVREQALAAFLKSGLDFGAVDVIYNAKREKAYVLEINTAPGLEGNTVGIYANALERRANALLHM
jgi:glutathione synthase/RimK-type ligase-like ATP-grasp enzyme